MPKVYDTITGLPVEKATALWIKARLLEYRDRHVPHTHAAALLGITIEQVEAVFGPAPRGTPSPPAKRRTTDSTGELFAPCETLSRNPSPRPKRTKPNRLPPLQ